MPRTERMSSDKNISRNHTVQTGQMNPNLAREASHGKQW